ncbi:MAG TPA: hypothetical protein PK950_01790 [Candidatus Paceibacterota bacterium]|nr:hypothetical protein [Candidatus Paceibacterota bacterium]
MIRSSGNTNWSGESGFSQLSEGAQEIGRYADANGGSISGILKEKPELLGSLDEFHNWSAITVASISGKTSVSSSQHHLKKLFNK